MATSQTPQQIVEDRKVAGLLDDPVDDCLDADKTAKKISTGQVFRAIDSKSQSAFNTTWDALLSAVDASETERDVCLKGKARDTRKLKTCLQTQLDTLSALEESVGRMEVLEDAAVEAVTTTALASITLVLGIWPKVAILQKDLEDVRKQLEKAILAALDAKVKASVSAAAAAIGICLTPFGAAVAVTGGIALFLGKQALGAVLNGNEDSTVKKTWSAASGAVSVSKSLFGLSDAIGPAMILVTGAVDIGECFANEREKTDLLDRIKVLKRAFDTTVAQAARDFDTLGKACAEAQAALAKAMAAVKAVRAAKPASAAVMRYL